MNELITLKNVRLSFPNLFQYEKYEGSVGEFPKYTATFIISKESKENLSKIRKQLVQIKKKASKPIESHNICLKDGDKTERNEYLKSYALRASTRKRPLTVNIDKTPVAEEDAVFYPGCYVDAVISFWHYEKKNMICANLHAVRFLKDGEEFVSISADEILSKLDDIKELPVEEELVEEEEEDDFF